MKNHTTAAPAPFFVASTVAEAFADASEASDEDRRLLIATAIDIGQHLADEGHPGRWDLFEPAGLFEKIGFLSPNELVGSALRMMGLVGFLALQGHLCLDRAVVIFDAIEECAPPCAVLSGFKRSFTDDLSRQMAALRPN